MKRGFGVDGDADFGSADGFIAWLDRDVFAFRDINVVFYPYLQMQVLHSNAPTSFFGGLKPSGKMTIGILQKT